MYQRHFESQTWLLCDMCIGLIWNLWILYDIVILRLSLVHLFHSFFFILRQIGLTLLPGFSALAGTADGFHSFHHRMWLSQLCHGTWCETCKRTWIGWPKILTYMGRYKHISKTSNAESSPTPTLEESFLSKSFSQRYLLLVSLVLQVASVM